MMRIEPSTQSSININERVCSPSPHISKSFVEQTALRQNAAGAFSRPPCRSCVQSHDERGRGGERPRVSAMLPQTHTPPVKRAQRFPNTIITEDVCWPGERVGWVGRAAEQCSPSVASFSSFLLPKLLPGRAKVRGIHKKSNNNKSAHRVRSVVFFPPVPSSRSQALYIFFEAVDALNLAPPPPPKKKCRHRAFHVPRGPYTLWYRAILVWIGKSAAYALHISSWYSFSKPYVS